MAKLFFLPGAGGSADFWRPAAEDVLPERRRHFFSWPGLGNEPHLPEVRGVNDLVVMVLAEIQEPADLIAQSMGGLVAIKVALAAPEKVRRLVLTATSGGVPVEDLGGANWQVKYRHDFPNAATWITETREDLSSELRRIVAPTLLLWGDRDAVSPLAVGDRLKACLPQAELVVVQGGDHDLALTHAADIARLIADHLR